MLWHLQNLEEEQKDLPIHYSLERKKLVLTRMKE
jgi:hypothetical protein